MNSSLDPNRSAHTSFIDRILRGDHTDHVRSYHNDPEMTLNERPSSHQGLVSKGTRKHQSLIR